MRGHYFTEEELSCKCCGENRTKQELINLLDELREELGKPVYINSAYRCPKHDGEAGGKGRHQTGFAADVRTLTVGEKHAILKLAFMLGFTGVGVANTFVHLDVVPAGMGFPTPAVWTYQKRE